MKLGKALRRWVISRPERVRCPDCGEEVLRTLLYDHQVLRHSEARRVVRITDELASCPKCHALVRVGECTPDVDGDGGLGCPRCGTVIPFYAPPNPALARRPGIFLRFEAWLAAASLILDYPSTCLLCGRPGMESAIRRHVVLEHTAAWRFAKKHHRLPLPGELK